jgi:hypothetical protein
MTYLFTSAADLMVGPGSPMPPAGSARATRVAKHFVAWYGDIAVELEALPVDVLRQRMIAEIESRIDMSALVWVQALELYER